jgi:pyruvate-formate lyase-activating enzyme
MSIMRQSPDKIQCFLIDYGIYRDCNLVCDYCRPSLIIDKNTGRQNSDRLKLYIEGLTNVSQHVRAVMFKTSGWGEITLLPGYTELFQHARHLGYEVLQLITNGTLITESKLAELQSLGYFSLQLSIDGLTSAENRYRNPLPLKLVFSNLELALRMGIPVEINTVLTDANTASLKPFFDELLRLYEKYKTPIVCVPRRVKIKPTLNNYNQIPNRAMIDELEKTISGYYLTYSSILPPEAYLKGLLYYLRTGQRNWVSYDTLVRIIIGSTGDIVKHTTSGNKLLGSVLRYGDSQGFETRFHLHSPTGDPDHQTKMTQFDIHYLYLAGKLSLSEISKIPSCSNPISQNWLQNLRKVVFYSETNTRVSDCFEQH